MVLKFSFGKDTRFKYREMDRVRDEVSPGPCSNLNLPSSIRISD